MIITLKLCYVSETETQKHIVERHFTKKKQKEILVYRFWKLKSDNKPMS